MAPDSSGSGCIGLQGHNGTGMFEAGGREAPQLEWRDHLVLAVSSFVWILNHAMCLNCVHTKPHLRWSRFSILHFAQSHTVSGEILNFGGRTTLSRFALHALVEILHLASSLFRILRLA